MRRALLLLALASCVHGPDVSELERRLAALESRVVELPMSAPQFDEGRGIYLASIRRPNVQKSLLAWPGGAGGLSGSGNCLNPSASCSAASFTTTGTSTALSFTATAGSGVVGLQLTDLAKVSWSNTNIQGNGTGLFLNSNGATMLTLNRTGPVAQTVAGSGLTAVDVEGTLNSNTTAVGNLGASGPDDLQTYSMPANTLTVTGRCVRVTAIGTTANNANAKTVRLVYGAGPTVLVSKQLTASIAGTWKLEGTVCRTGSSAQRYVGSGEQSGGTTVSTTDGTGVWRIPAVTGTTTESETGAIVFKTQSTASTTDNDIVSNVLQEEIF